MRKERVAILTNIITPYRVDLFNTLAKKFENFEVFFYAKTEKNRLWEIKEESLYFKYSILEGLKLWFKEKPIYFSHTLFFKLLKYSPDYIIAGGYTPNSLIAICYAKLYHKKFILWSDATPHNEKHISSLKNLYRRILHKLSDGYLASSKEAMKYFISMGASRDKIVMSLLTFDVKSFSNRVENERKNKKNLKKKLGLRKIVLLTSGRLVKYKGFKELLKVLKDLIKEFNDFSLIVLGDGPMKEELVQYSEENQLPTYFAGFIQPEELPKFYAVSDIFVFPTFLDPWGIVVNEAVAARLPVICSKYYGSKEIVINGFNGYIIDPNDTKDFREKILELIIDKNKREIMAHNSKSILESCTIENAADGFVKIINILKMNIC